MRHILVSIFVLGFALAAAQLAACGGETITAPDTGFIPAPNPTACVGTCSCGTGNKCACAVNEICTQNCAGTNGCDVACSGTSKCTVTGQEGLQFACSNSSSCTGTSAKSAQVQCSNSSQCTGLTLGDSSQVQCSNSSNCEAEVGADSQMSCTENAVCKFTCKGSCQFACGDVTSNAPKCTCIGAGCKGTKFTCIKGTTITPPTDCGGDKYVCNQSC